MRFRIITPLETKIDLEVDLVTLPGSKGVFGVMPGHTKFITNIKKGIIDISVKGETQKFYIHGGVAQIDEDELNVLGEFAQDLGQIRDVEVKDKISDLNSSLKALEEDSLDAKIIQNKIDQFEGLHKYL